MKDRITREQVMMLNKEQRSKLREIWEPNKHDLIVLEGSHEEGIIMGFEDLNEKKILLWKI